MTQVIVTVETAAGVVLDSAPITEASSVTVTESVDKIGKVSFSMPATSIRADVLYPSSGATRYVRINAFRNGTWIEAAHGIVTSKQKDSSSRILQPSGVDLFGELSRTHVGKLTLSNGTGGPMAAASVLSSIMAYALPGWTITGTPSKDVYFKFGDETVFAALTKVRDYCGDHFRRNGRQLVWLPTTTSGFDAVDSGLIAVDSGDNAALASNPAVVLIDGGLQIVHDDTDRITRTYPRGAGNADAQLTITNAQRFGASTTPTTGTYTSGDYEFVIVDPNDPWQSYIRYVPGEPTTSDVISEAKSFRDIAAIGTAAADTVSAANALFDAALTDLKQRVQAQLSFRMALTKVHATINVGEALRVIVNHYVDGYGWLTLDEHVMVLEKTTRYDGRGDPKVDVQVTL